MSSFRYERPATLAEATALLAACGGRAKVLAGGTDLLVALRSGETRPELVLDIKGLPGLADLGWTAEGDLVLGACVPVQRIADDPRIREVFPALAEGAGAIGSLQIRSRATVGGNLANASPCMDTAPPLLVLGALVRVAGPGGVREIPLAQFFRGVKTTALAPDEIVTAVVVPRPVAGIRSAFDKIKRVAGQDLALVNAAAVFDPAAHTVRVAIGSCGVTPVMPPPLSGVDPAAADPAAVGGRLAALALEVICPIDDVRSSAEYRRDMAALLCRRLAARLLGGRREALAMTNPAGGPSSAPVTHLVTAMPPIPPPSASPAPTTDSARGTCPITLTVNGEISTLEVPPERTLLDLLKSDLHRTSLKNGCGIGECGACTVIIDGRPVNACLVLALEADGAVIETAEGAAPGLGELSDLQQAFIDFGAIQCGFCTPGMLNSARALLRRTPHPTRDEIIEALAGNLCRCTGYEPLVRAVEAVASGTYRPSPPPSAPYVGGAANRLDGAAKVTGSALFVHDLVLPGMLHARILTSPHPSARIVRMDTTRARAMAGVKAVLIGEDLPYKLGLYMEDKDILARGVVRYQGEAVAAAAAETVEQAAAACAAVEVDYEPLEPVLDVQAALQDGAPQVHPDLSDYSWMKGVFFPQPGRNIAHLQKIRKGDAQRGLAKADRVFEFSFGNPPVQHMPLETHTAIATARPDGEVEIVTSAQSPFTVRSLFCRTFGLPLQKVRVRVPYVGGGFGGKAGIHLEPLVYCLSRAAGGRPVKLVATREEEFNTLPSRQGLRSTIRTGVTADGRITALDITYLWDAGAYADYGVNVGRAAAYSGAGPYVVPSCSIDSLVVYTNKIFGTAYRGFGHLEVLWGIERNMDLVARALGIDPYEFRQKNLLRVGETTITGERFTEGHGRPDECLRLVAEAIGWDPKERAASPVAPGSGMVRGKGLAMLHKGPAMPTSTACSATILFNGDGSANVLVSGVDYGQGTYTALAQIAADELRIPLEKVRIPWESDTDYTPYDWQTVASRFAVMGGNAIIEAAKDCLDQIRSVAGRVLGTPAEEIQCGDGRAWVRGDPARKLDYSQVVLGYTYANGNSIGGPVIGHGRYIAHGLTNLDPDTGQGLPALNWTYGAHGVEVEVDTDTGHVRVLRIASAIDAGKVLNRAQAEAQVVGGVVQGLGSAILEKFVFEEGKLLNNSLVDYKIPTARDIPAEMLQFFVETPHPEGPYGARGVAEHPMISVPGAVGNALSNATGVEFNELPLDAERVYLGLKRAAASRGDR
jgi:CO/xanthine dehydrogenase Mo-binding subunit/CO/xanthine dehydrogenase FAD-binding subunit/aerobic-type carbon monoxide dehydrogenase small subunit (CoxS/CutS family)